MFDHVIRLSDCDSVARSSNCVGDLVEQRNNFFIFFIKKITLEKMNFKKYKSMMHFLEILKLGAFEKMSII